LENNAMADLPAEFGMMKNLFIFSSKKNKIIYIDPAISRCTNLMYMELYNTKLDSLPKSMQNLRRLELLRIVANESDTMRIPEELTSLRGLRDLQLLNCNLYKLPKTVQNFDAMERMIISGCKLDSLPDNFGYMPRLKHLDLENNSILVLPPSFTKLKKLEYLSLRNNKLTELPDGLVWLTKLQTLDVRGNSISDQSLEILRLSLPNCRIIKDAPKKKVDK
jgi:Leucine-rich repeat (LRR) protein